MPQKTSKKGKKKKKEDELSEEEKVALCSVPDRKGQKAKSEGVSAQHLACVLWLCCVVCVHVISADYCGMHSLSLIPCQATKFTHCLEQENHSVWQ